LGTTRNSALLIREAKSLISAGGAVMSAPPVSSSVGVRICSNSESVNGIRNTVTPSFDSPATYVYQGNGHLEAAWRWGLGGRRADTTDRHR
jgi:hypothetical protein